MRVLMLVFLLFFVLISCGGSDDMKAESASGVQKKIHQDTNFMEGYKPHHPINFSHSKHAEMQGIDCKYCHTPIDDKVALNPSEKICLDCHTSTKGDELLENYPGKNGVVWKKVENLPDSVFFNPNETRCPYIKNGHALIKNTSQLDTYECAKCHY